MPKIRVGFHSSSTFPIELVIIDFVKIAVVALLAAAYMSAQTSLGTSSLGGTITDDSGAFVPGAQIVLTDVQHGVKRNAVSNDSGNYVVNGLPASQYQLEVTKPGFDTFSYNDFGIAVNQRATVDVKLKVG